MEVKSQQMAMRNLFGGSACSQKLGGPGGNSPAQCHWERRA